jgi:hypothetical protein
MSWMPDAEPALSDRRSCAVLEAVIEPRPRDLGGFEVRRTLPHRDRRSVGPFVFFDHLGPVRFPAGRGMDVRPHPHIGLATVTYLLTGSVLHRDSLGNVQVILPGALNLMTAGRGIAHSERTPPELRAAGAELFGLQSWVALPLAHEEVEPSFQHIAAERLPLVEDRGWKARVIAGAAFGAASPVERLSDWFYVDVSLDAGAAVPLDPDHEERALYIVDGEVEILGEGFAAPRLLLFRAGERIAVAAARNTRLMLLGGAPLDGPRHLWWNFVSSRPDRIEQAKEDWRAGRFAPVPHETDFIPLPD